MYFLMGLEKAACLVLKCYFKHRVSLDAITKSVQGKLNCITVNFDRTQHGFYLLQNFIMIQL